MISELMDVGAAAKAQAEEIVSSGTEIRPRLAEVVARKAGQSPEAGGLLKVLRAATDGAREGFARTVPQNQDRAGG
jgi:hypothetical protein